jgi:DNA-binding transcriptional LysR family regulator
MNAASADENMAMVLNIPDRDVRCRGMKRWTAWGSLNVFVQAADARSFTLAASQLSISPSAVGEAISRLEERLGVRLFHRSTRTILLTPEGALFLERCRRILGEVEAAEVELAQTQGEPRGKLRVSMPLASMLMLPALTAFMWTYPQVQLDLDFNDRLVDVIEEGFDAVVRAGDAADSRRMLGAFHLKLVASPAYLAARGVPHQPDDLAEHACLHHRFKTSGKLERWPLRKNGDDIELALPETAIVNTMEPLICMAEQGLGITCLPDFAIRQQLATGTLQTVLDDFVAHSGPFRLLWPSSRHLSPKLRAFVDFMATHLFAQQTFSPR